MKSDVYSLGVVLWEMAARLMTQKYAAPYSEYKHITLDFQIIIAAAKKDTRPSIPAACPEVIAQMIDILWRPKPDDRPDATILEDMIIRAEQVSISLYLLAFSVEVLILFVNLELQSQ